MVYANAPRWETARVFYLVTLHTFIYAFLFATLKRPQAGQKPRFFVLYLLTFMLNFG